MFSRSLRSWADAPSCIIFSIRLPYVTLVYPFFPECAENRESIPLSLAETERAEAASSAAVHKNCMSLCVFICPVLVVKLSRFSILSYTEPYPYRDGMGIGSRAVLEQRGDSVVAVDSYIGH